MGSTNSDLLAQLRDIHLPKPIMWWPLAIGWIGLLVIVFVLCLLMFLFARRYYQRGRARREGMRLLIRYEKDYQQGVSSQIVSTQISDLLRRVALVYFPRQEIAGLQGEPWLDFLNKTGRGVKFDEVRDCLLMLPYQANHSMDLTLLFFYAKKWIQQRRGPCLN